MGERVSSTWWLIRKRLRRCPECGVRGYATESPRWDTDPIARMLDVAHFGCPCCGKGAIAQRDALRPTATEEPPREPQNRALPDVEGETGLGDQRPKSKKAQGRNYDGGVR